MPRKTKKSPKSQLLRDAANEMDELNARKRKELSNLQFNIRTKFKNKKQKEMAQMIKENRITFVEGPAGTGKSLISLKTGLEILKHPEEYNISNIMITKPIVSVSYDIGALPGDINDKTYIYFNSIYANLDKIVDKEVAKFLRNNLIEERIINYMRGETFGNVNEEGEPTGVFCILDEGQNTSINEMKTYLSRLGEDSKIVVLYDPDQIDIKTRNNEKCGAVDAAERLESLDGVGYFKFEDDDIVRDPFLIEIMKRYRN